MSVSESLWNEDELLTQMEQMQDQIEDLEQERQELKEELEGKNALLEEQEQANSSEILQLQSALQQALKKVQEQSEQIVKMNGADLILQDNEKLKRENVRLHQEKERSEKEAARVEEACKKRLQKKEDDLKDKYHKAEEREMQAKKKELQADDLVRNRQRLIDQEVEAARNRISQESARKCSRLINELRQSFIRKEKTLNKRMTWISLYAFGLSIVLACRSGPYLQVLIGTGDQIWSWSLLLWKMVCRIAEIGAGISDMLPVPVIADIFRKTIYALLIFMICAVLFMLLLITAGWIHRQIKQYLQIWWILLWMNVIIVLTVCLGRRIYLFTPVNAIWLGVLSGIIICVCDIGYKKRRSRRN